MTKKEKVLQKIDEMMPDVEQAIRKRIEFSLNSGAIDPEDFNENEFILPKLLLLDGLYYAMDQYKPHRPGKNFTESLENLRKF